MFEHLQMNRAGDISYNLKTSRYVFHEVPVTQYEPEDRKEIDASTKTVR